MDIETTNRDIEQLGQHSLSQIKRWVVAFLSPDPGHGQHSGKARRYNFSEAATIMVAGFLITVLKYNIQETKTILKDINEWLTSQGWDLSSFVKIRKPHKSTQNYIALSNEDQLGWIELEIHIGKGGKGSFIYIAKVIKERTSDNGDADCPIFHEKYQLHYFGEDSSISLEPEKTLYLSQTIRLFAHRICRNL